MGSSLSREFASFIQVYLLLSSKCISFSYFFFHFDLHFLFLLAFPLFIDSSWRNLLFFITVSIIWIINRPWKIFLINSERNLTPFAYSQFIHSYSNYIWLWVNLSIFHLFLTYHITLPTAFFTHLLFLWLLKMIYLDLKIIIQSHVDIIFTDLYLVVVY